MPVPKRRHTRSRRGKRRSQWKISAPNFGNCPQCGAPVLPHHACSSCGNYRGRKVIVIKEKKAKQSKKGE